MKTISFMTSLRPSTLLAQLESCKVETFLLHSLHKAVVQFSKRQEYDSV